MPPTSGRWMATRFQVAAGDFACRLHQLPDRLKMRCTSNGRQRQAQQYNDAADAAHHDVDASVA